MPRIFISYSRENEDIARRLASDLDRLGVDVWIDVDDIPAGMNWSTAVQQGLDACEVMIVIISPESMASVNVGEEWQAYRDDGKPIIPILWQPTRVHFQLRRIQHIDFHNRDYETAFAQLHSELLQKGISLQPLLAQNASEPISITPAPEWPILPVIELLPPPFEWIKIPAGQVTLMPSEIDKKQSYLKQDTTFDVPVFMIAKYPLTNAQYAKFMAAGGYQEQKWWTAVGWHQCELNGWIEPRYWQDAKWNGADRPVVGVSWYEVMAFCQWLSGASGEPVTLPTEQQWQRVAQGDDGRKYPWMRSFDPGKCNTEEGEIGHTTSVTRYPDGASPFGVMDMAGNVWEWCLTAYESGSTEIDGPSRRVLRGGSWDHSRDLARAAYRFRDDPFRRSFFSGFRMACVSPIY